MRAVARVIGADRTSVFGSVLIGFGLLLLAYAAGMYADLVPGGRVLLPRPPALDRPRPSTPATTGPAPAAPAPAAEPAASTGPAEGAVAPIPAAAAHVSAPPAALPAPAPPADSAKPMAAGPAAELPVPVVGSEALVERPDPAVFLRPMVPADAAERLYRGNRPPPGLAVRLRIPATGLETEVVPAGVVANQDGELEWQTVPFVAAHYVETAPVGARGNAVIAGHVVTRFEGNVFRDLYRVEVGDTVETETEDGRFVYTVRDLKLVSPTAVEVMAATREPRLTLVTCAGEFDPRTRQFSERLVVVAELTDWTRSGGG